MEENMKRMIEEKDVNKTSDKISDKLCRGTMEKLTKNLKASKVVY